MAKERHVFIPPRSNHTLHDQVLPRCLEKVSISVTRLSPKLPSATSSGSETLCQFTNPKPWADWQGQGSGSGQGPQPWGSFDLGVRATSPAWEDGAPQSSLWQAQCVRRDRR